MTMTSTHLRKRSATLTLKHVVDQLQRRLSLSPSLSHGVVGRRSCQVPKDVKEGHFVVLAMGDDCPKRFIVALRYLNHPQFLQLLERAAEEFGFHQGGALSIPCRPSELERILG